MLLILLTIGVSIIVRKGLSVRLRNRFWFFVWMFLCVQETIGLRMFSFEAESICVHDCLVGIGGCVAGGGGRVCVCVRERERERERGKWWDDDARVICVCMILRKKERDVWCVRYCILLPFIFSVKDDRRTHFLLSRVHHFQSDLPRWYLLVSLYLNVFLSLPMPSLKSR